MYPGHGNNDGAFYSKPPKCHIFILLSSQSLQLQIPFNFENIACIQKASYAVSRSPKPRIRLVYQAFARRSVRANLVRPWRETESHQNSDNWTSFALVQVKFVPEKLLHKVGTELNSGYKKEVE
jgi:hypothetical protein